MESVLLVCFNLIFFFIDIMLILNLVFFVFKYCDMMENKGVFINIGFDFKFRFIQFDVVFYLNIWLMVRFFFF